MKVLIMNDMNLSLNLQKIEKNTNMQNYLFNFPEKKNHKK